jgi:hypothetical protein
MAQVSVSKASQNLSHWTNQASYGRECVIVTAVWLTLSYRNCASRPSAL